VRLLGTKVNRHVGQFLDLVKLGYEVEEAINPHSGGQGKPPSRGLPGFFSRKIHLLWRCQKPTKLEFATYGQVVDETHQGLQGP